MNYTTNFNLNKPEGTDLYNHLTVDNPNMDTIDAAMQANKLASVGAATELVSGTVHAITRSDSDQNIFKFKATGDFKVGDTITVDGVSVNAYTTGGQQLIDDAYVLSAEVLCVLDGTSLWVLSNKTPVASDIPYNNVNTVAEMINYLNTMYITDDTTSTNLTIASGDRGIFNLDITKSGYTPVAVAGVALGNNWLSCGSFFIYGNEALVVLHNDTTSSRDTNITVKVLYRKNTI